MSDSPLGVGTLPIGTGRIQGTVVDAAGKGLGKVIVTLSLGTGSGSIMTKYENEAGRGKWSLMGLGYGTYQVKAELAGYGPETFTAVISEFSANKEYTTVLHRL
jgi:hypothetical protein